MRKKRIILLVALIISCILLCSCKSNRGGFDMPGVNIKRNSDSDTSTLEPNDETPLVATEKTADPSGNNGSEGGKGNNNGSGNNTTYTDDPTFIPTGDPNDVSQILDEPMVPETP